MVCSIRIRRGCGTSTILRAEHRRSPRTEADAAHVAVKTEMLQLRLMEKRNALVKRDDVDAMIDQHGRPAADAPVGLPGAVRRS